MFSMLREQISSAALASLLLLSFHPTIGNPTRLQSQEDPSSNSVSFPASDPQSSENKSLSKQKYAPTHWHRTTNEAAWDWETVTTTDSSNTVGSAEACNCNQVNISLADFGYTDSNGPHVWETKFPTCGGIRQSPINLNLENAVKPPEGVDPAVFLKFYDAPAVQITLSNTGHSIRMTGNWSAGRRPTVSGAVLNGEYAVSEVHLHWGEDEQEGSEHFVNGECYPLEMHVVHYKAVYGSFNEARKYNDGLAVISYLFEVQDEKNPGLQRLIQAGKQVLEPETPPIALTPFSLDKLATPFTRNYASYPGSLTTPPCSEIVTWIVNLTPQGVSSDQLIKLRKMKTLDGRRILKNFRPLQGLNGRVIKFVP